MKNVISKNYVCVTDCEGKTLKKVVFGRQDEEVLFLFTDGTFSRLKAEGYEDGEASLETVSHVLNSDLLLRAYPLEVLREFVPKENLDQWVSDAEARERREREISEQRQFELYKALHARFGNL